MIVVYTAIFGDYDDLAPVAPVPGVRYVAFTDQEEDVDGWECLRPVKTEETDRMENRKYKTHPLRLFPSAERIIYMDGNLRLKVDPHEIVKDTSPGISLFRHNKRSDIYEEAEAVAKITDKDTLDSQVRRYRHGKHPFPASQVGLFWGGFIVRGRRSDLFDMRWWMEVQGGVERDQISLPYCVWSTDVEYKVIEGDIPFYGGVNKFVDRVPHKYQS